MPVDRTNVAALIPSYFEGKRIAEVATRTLAHVDRVLVVDDGSTDETEAQARQSGAEVLRHTENQGKGAAIKTGLRELSARSGVEHILVLDGDGQHLPEEIPRFFDAANSSDAGMFVGNRMSDVVGMPFVRRLTNRIMSAQISAACGQSVPDTQCGFRMLRVALAPILADCPSTRYDFETEILVIASLRGFKIAAVPVSTVYGDEKSKIHPVRDTLRFIRLMRRLKRTS